MAVLKRALILGFFAFIGFQLPLVMADCPLDLRGSNFTIVATMCSSKGDIGKCCRYMNAFVAVSVARFANSTGNLGVPLEMSEICLDFISKTMEMYGVPRNATIFCGLGVKIPVNYDCMGRTTMMQMLQSPNFEDVGGNCKLPLSQESTCRQCLNAGISYLRHLVGPENNLTVSTCRDAMYTTLASRVDNSSAFSLASCFFQVKEFSTFPVSQPSQSSPAPKASPSPLAASGPANDVSAAPLNDKHRSFHLTVVPAIGIAVTAASVTMVIILIFLICRKSRELADSENVDKNASKTFPSPWPAMKFPEGNSSVFRKFSYKETKNATDNFNAVIGHGGFGTVYKAQFNDGSVVAVKRMNNISEQGEDDLCREIELLARLHHRHLVGLKGFCIKKKERFLMYEYMANGSLKDHLHSPGKAPLSWRTRIQIAIDVANALEYLHFYCDPPLCHRDIKSSNILLDENNVAKNTVSKELALASLHEPGKYPYDRACKMNLADFGLAHASKHGSICFEPLNTDICGTPGYIDPEYVATQELTEKSDVYSYGVLLLELVTGKRAVQDTKNLVETSESLMASESGLPELVDPRIKDSFDVDQLRTMVTIIAWCTRKEGRSRPSMKQVLRLLYESSDPLHSGFVRAVEDEEHEEFEGPGRTSKGKRHKSDSIYHSGDARGLASSSSTSRSYCSRSLLLEQGSPQSPPNMHISEWCN